MANSDPESQNIGKTPGFISIYAIPGVDLASFLGRAALDSHDMISLDRPAQDSHDMIFFGLAGSGIP